MIKLFKRNRNWLKDNWFVHLWEKGRARFFRMSRGHLALAIFLGMLIVVLSALVVAFHLYHPSVRGIINQPLPERIELDLNNPPLIFDFSTPITSFGSNEAVELKINLHNDGQIPVSNIEINFLMLDKNFSVNRIKLSADTNESGITINNKKITIDSLSADEDKEIVIEVSFKNNNSATRIVKWQTQEEYSIKGQIVKESTVLPSLYLKAELQAQAVIYYNSPQGDELGSGPLPPLVGLPTNYWVFFDVKSTGEFKDVVFSAKLPEEVELTGMRSLLAGDFFYNASSRQIIWKIPELKNQDDSYRVGFEIQFIPDEQQVGDSAVLLSNLQCYALDSLVSGERQMKLKDLNTNLDFDKINKGAGIIDRP